MRMFGESTNNPDEITVLYGLGQQPPVGTLAELGLDALLALYLAPFNPADSAFAVFERCERLARSCGAPPHLAGRLARSAVMAHRRRVRCAKWLAAMHNRGLFNMHAGQPGGVLVDCGGAHWRSLPNAVCRRDGRLYWRFDVVDDATEEDEAQAGRREASVRFYIAALCGDEAAAAASGAELHQGDWPPRHFSLRPFAFGTQVERYWTSVLKLDAAADGDGGDAAYMPRMHDVHRMTAQSALTEAAMLDAPCLVADILRRHSDTLDVVHMQAAAACAWRNQSWQSLAVIWPTVAAIGVDMAQQLALPAEAGDNQSRMQMFCERLHEHCFDAPDFVLCLTTALWRGMPRAYKPADGRTALAQHAAARGLDSLCNMYAYD